MSLAAAVAAWDAVQGRLSVLDESHCVSLRGAGSSRLFLEWLKAIKVHSM